MGLRWDGGGGGGSKRGVPPCGLLGQTYFKYLEVVRLESLISGLLGALHQLVLLD